jgi:hypothetical protein
MLNDQLLQETVETLVAAQGKVREGDTRRAEDYVRLAAVLLRKSHVETRAKRLRRWGLVYGRVPRKETDK